MGVLSFGAEVFVVSFLAVPSALASFLESAFIVSFFPVSSVLLLASSVDLLLREWTDFTRRYTTRYLIFLRNERYNIIT